LYRLANSSTCGNIVSALFDPSSGTKILWYISPTSF
jgi:hypothetical protein